MVIVTQFNLRVEIQAIYFFRLDRSRISNFELPLPIYDTYAIFYTSKILMSSRNKTLNSPSSLNFLERDLRYLCHNNSNYKS